MPKFERLRHQLRYAPTNVHEAILADVAGLKPGQAAVLGRFFQHLQARQRRPDAPGVEPFRDAAASEGTLMSLLRALDRYAPMVPLADGRQLRQEYYLAGRGAHIDRTPSRSAAPPSTAPAQWPLYWRELWPGLARTRIKEKTKMRYLASISRCADFLPELDLPDDPALLVPSYFLGIQLGELLGDRDIRPATIANYLQGLVSLMRHGGGDPVALEGIRSAQQHYVRFARRVPKLKVTRIRSLMENGGFGYILQRVADCQRDANALPRYSAQRFRLLQAAAILALMANKPARTGDVAKWRLGHELTRDPYGAWSLHWAQMKTGHETGAGELWPETCVVLDSLLLQDKPERLAHLAYTQLRGKNWLTHHPSPPADNWPSMLVCEILGVPMQDLRTLAADYIRRYDPANAPGVIQSHLGHMSTRSGEEYRVLAEGDAAAESWRSLRDTLKATRLPKA